MSDTTFLLVRKADGIVADAVVGAPEASAELDVVERSGSAAAAWIGWQRQADGSYALPAPVPTQAALYAYASARRYALETGGSVPIGGAAVPTDERTRAMVTAGVVKAKDDPTFVIESWKVSPGVYVTLDAPTIIAIGDALTSYVQALFDKNKAVDADIAAGSITTTAGVDAALA